MKAPVYRIKRLQYAGRGEVLANHECILRNIGCYICIAEHTQDSPIGHLLVAQYQLIKGVDITTLTAGDELFFIVSHKICHLAASLLLVSFEPV
jgi:hypothetical protein